MFFRRTIILLAIFVLGAVPYNSFAALITPNDTLFSEQWYLQKIQASGAWGKSTGSHEVTVAVLDTGIDLDHPDIASRLWLNTKEYPNNKDDDNNGFIDDSRGWDFVDNDNDPSPDIMSNNLTRSGVNHGTILAGIIGAATGNGEGVAGINWRVSIMPIRVLDSEGLGNVLNVEKGVRYAIKQGADVINLSFVGKTFSPSLYNAVLEAWKNNIVVVTAVGNIGVTGENLDQTPLYPACFAGPAGENIILSVAATDRDDRLASFSNFGETCIDVSAPAVGIFSTQVSAPNNTIFRESYGGGWSGTSLAAAVVSGIAALIKSFNRDLRADEITQLISNNSENIDKVNPEKIGKVGWGRVNAFLALQATEDYLLGQGRSFVKKGEIVVAPDIYNGEQVRIFDSSGSFVGNISAYEIRFNGGVGVSSGDTNGDGFRELLTAPDFGGGPHIKIWRSDGKLASQFFAYEKEFNGGVRAVFANLDGSGSEQVVTVPGPGREAEVRVWGRDGKLFNKFLAFPENYKGGASISASDFDNDGQDEIIVVPSGSFEPVVKIFRSDGILISSFLVEAKRFRGGLQLAIGDLNGDGWKEILTAPKTGLAKIRVWNYIGRELRPAFVLGVKLAKNLRLAVGDLDGDGKAEILQGYGRGSSATVLIYDAKLKLKKTFLAYPKNKLIGANIAVVD